MASSRDFDVEDRDDRPRRKRKKKSRPSSLLLVALGAGIGVLILMLAGGVGALIYYGGPGGGSFSLAGLMPHSALMKPATIEMYHQFSTMETLSSVERKLGPGCPLTAAEAESTMLPHQSPNAGFGEPTQVSLKQLSARPPGNTQITQWFQWGSGASRLFIGVGKDDKGEAVVLLKYYVAELPGGGYESMSEGAGVTLTFGQPEVRRPRR
jgi:hypothetical protein